MQVNSINNSQSFQARIKINKSNLTKIATSAGLGTTAVASFAAQTDYDLACANATVAAINHAQEPAYKGVTLPLINAASDCAHEENPNSVQSTTATVGALATPLLSMQLGSSAGYNLLDKVTGKKLSETVDDISFNLGKEGRQNLSIANAAPAVMTSFMVSGNGLDNQENLASLGTTVSTAGIYNTSTIADAYDKTSKYNKKLPS